MGRRDSESINPYTVGKDTKNSPLFLKNLPINPYTVGKDLLTVSIKNIFSSINPYTVGKDSAVDECLLISDD